VRCPDCDSTQHIVLNSKPSESKRSIAAIRHNDNCIRRRRECLRCDYRWTTIEEIEERRTK